MEGGSVAGWREPVAEDLRPFRVVIVDAGDVATMLKGEPEVRVVHGRLSFSERRRGLRSWGSSRGKGRVV